jgi:hypothetical protein
MNRSGLPPVPGRRLHPYAPIGAYQVEEVEVAGNQALDFEMRSNGANRDLKGIHSTPVGHAGMLVRNAGRER